MGAISRLLLTSGKDIPLVCVGANLYDRSRVYLISFSLDSRVLEDCGLADYNGYVERVFGGGFFKSKLNGLMTLFLLFPIRL